MNKIILGAILVSLLCSGNADAKTLTFKDLPDTATHYGPLGTYEGFTWSSDFYYFNGALGSDYANGLMPGDSNAAFNAFGSDYVGLTSDNVFNFEGAVFTSVYWAGQDITIEGYGPGGAWADVSFRIDKTPTWHDVDLNNFDRFYISSESHFAMDNMTVSPEPISTVLFLAGGLPLAAGLYRKRKRS